MVFQGVVGGEDGTKIKLHYSYKIKRNSVRILQRNSKSSVNSINGRIQ